jgi:restriction endonuclease
MADTSIVPSDPRWKRFEKLVARLHATLAPNAAVTYDDHIPGRNSKAPRQIDVALRTNVGVSTVLIVVQCRDYASALDVNAVGEFVTVIEDVGAQKGVMVVTPESGFSEAAKNLAAIKNVDLLTLVDAENKIWAEYFGNEPVTFQQKLHWRALVAEKQFSVSFIVRWTGGPSSFSFPYDFHLAQLLHEESGAAAGTPFDVFGLLWRKDKFHEENVVLPYVIEFEKPMLIASDPSRSPIGRLIMNVGVHYVYRYGLIQTICSNI